MKLKNQYHITNCVGKYSMEQENWRALAPLPVPLACHAAVTVKNRLYVMGGWTPQVRNIAEPSSIYGVLFHPYCLCLLWRPVHIPCASTPLRTCAHSCLLHPVCSHCWFEKRYAYIISHNSYVFCICPDISYEISAFFSKPS